LLGSQQSGQIKYVGVELYQEMLEEQISITSNKVKTKEDSFVPNINLGLPIFIPDHYIKDTDLKIGIYRRIGNLENNYEVESFKDEMIDRFGIMPQEFRNLLDIVKIKHICLKLGIESLDSGPHGFLMKFCDNTIVGDSILKFMLKYPSQTKLRPNNKLIFATIVDGKNLILETNNLLNNIAELVQTEPILTQNA